MIYKCTNNSIVSPQQKEIGIKRNMVVKKSRFLRIKDPIGSTNVMNR